MFRRRTEQSCNCQFAFSIGLQERINFSSLAIRLRELIFEQFVTRIDCQTSRPIIAVDGFGDRKERWQIERQRFSATCACTNDRSRTPVYLQLAQNVLGRTDLKRCKLHLVIA